MKATLFTIISFALGIAQAYIAIPWRNYNSLPMPPPRKDIDSLSSTELTLFVLAMRQWQTSNSSVIGGYFQVAGIHGAPHAYWDNAGNYESTGQGNPNTGFCWHGDQNFYLWHRPYLALFEQQMSAVALNIAANWYQPQRSTYQAAANTLRLPYWDWAKSSRPGTVSAAISSAQITVGNPSNGQQMTIANPLYSYTLVQGASLGRAVLGTQSAPRTTYRASTYLRDMVNQGPSLQTSVARLLNTAGVCWNTFATYSSSERCSNSPAVTSLEGIHNTVHNTVCGSMCNLDTSAFDPIFWLHHCNVDRIGALWNYLNPNTRIVPTVASSGNLVYNSGIVRDETFTFLPFRWQDFSTSWWQPRWLYDVRATGYTYPEISDLPSTSTLLQRVQALYGTGRPQQAISSSSAKNVQRSDREPVDPRRRQSVLPGGSLSVPPPTADLEPLASRLISGNGSFHEYTVRCKIQRSVAPGVSFNLHVFFGKVDAQRVNNSDYLALPNHVGSFSVSQSSATGNAMLASTLQGIIPINSALLNLVVAGNLPDLKPATVRRYVRGNLSWRLVTVDGQDIGGDAHSHGLAIKVLHSVVTPHVDDVESIPVVSTPVDVTGLS